VNSFHPREAGLFHRIAASQQKLLAGQGPSSPSQGSNYTYVLSTVLWIAENNHVNSLKSMSEDSDPGTGRV
jgi:hypothetical protein